MGKKRILGLTVRLILGVNVCTSNPIFHGNFVMRSIHIPTGFNIDLVNEGDYGLGEMTALVSTSFSCLGATKYTKATLVWELCFINFNSNEKNNIFGVILWLIEVNFIYL